MRKLKRRFNVNSFKRGREGRRESKRSRGYKGTRMNFQLSLLYGFQLDNHKD